MISRRPRCLARPPFSRESTIRVDRDGVFWHDGQRVTHPKLAEAFARWIAIDEATSRYILRNDIDWCYITVEDAPLVVRSLRVTPDGVLLHLTDGTIETLDPSSLRIDGADVPYCAVRAGALAARFSRDAAYALLEHAIGAGDASGVTVRIGRREIAIPRVR
jgi:hypothetical protein